MQKQKAKVKTQNAKVKSASSLGVDFFVLQAVSGRSAEPSSPSRLWPLRSSSVLTFAFCVLTFAFAFCLLPTVLSAQGCAMCYNSASAAKAGAKEALANGVLILLVPPMVFFALITVVVYRHRNRFREPANWRPEHDRELQELLVDLAPANGIQGLGSGSSGLIKGNVLAASDRIDGATLASNPKLSRGRHLP